MVESCALCALYEKRKIDTKLYGENKFAIAVEAFNKNGMMRRIMFVLKRHTMQPTKKELDGLLTLLKEKAEFFGPPNIAEPLNPAVVHYHRHLSFPGKKTGSKNVVAYRTGSANVKAVLKKRKAR